MYQKIESVEDALKAAESAEREGLKGMYPMALQILAKRVNSNADSEYLNPIPDCSHHHIVDSLCTHPGNFTPECHLHCCPRISREIRDALEALE